MEKNRGEKKSPVRTEKVLNQRSKKMERAARLRLDLGGCEEEMAEEYRKIGRKVLALSNGKHGGKVIHPAFEKFSSIESAVLRLRSLEKRLNKYKIELSKLRMASVPKPRLRR